MPKFLILSCSFDSAESFLAHFLIEGMKMWVGLETSWNEYMAIYLYKL